LCEEEFIMKKTTLLSLAVPVVSLGLALFIVLAAVPGMAHKAKHTPEQLKAFEDVFMEQVRFGDLLFHSMAWKEDGDSTGTGMACAMYHPLRSTPSLSSQFRNRSTSSRRSRTDQLVHRNRTAEARPGSDAKALTYIRSNREQTTRAGINV
jgi:hypothetical protein